MKVIEFRYKYIYVYIVDDIFFTTTGSIQFKVENCYRKTIVYIAQCHKRDVICNIEQMLCRYSIPSFHNY